MRDWGLPPRWTGVLLSVLRIVAGLTFLEHGAQKLLGFPPSMPGMPPVAPFTMLWTGGVLELVGGALVVLGLLTRPAAFILAGEMAVGYWTFHAPKSFFPAINGGDAAILYCFVFLYLSAAGGGPWSLDALWRRGRGQGSVGGR
jgi:putative oxidoreductase